MSATATQTPAAPIQAPNANAPAPTPAPEAIRMLKVKIEGKEVDMPEAEVLQLASAGKVSSQRFQEAAAMKKAAEEILSLSKKDQVEFFKKNGVNPREWAEKFLMDELKKEAESPEQRTNRENEEKLRKYESAEKDREQKQKQEYIDRLTNEKRQEYDTMFVKALEESKLPKTPFTIKRMAELQLINMKKGFELGASQLAKIVREDYVNEHKTLLSGYDGDQLIEFLGPEVVKKLSKAQIAKLKSRGVTAPQRSAQPSAKQEEGLSWAEYQRRNRRKA